jgi:hypothetical protein
VLNAKVPVNESPSKENRSRPREAAKRVVRASPQFGSHEGLIIEIPLTIWPVESLL